jgi:hypothetical protein
MDMRDFQQDAGIDRGNSQKYRLGFQPSKCSIFVGKPIAVLGSLAFSAFVIRANATALAAGPNYRIKVFQLFVIRR